MSHRFKKQFGQNFLRNATFAKKVASYLEAEEGDQIIEVGPGDGMLTRILLESGANVTAVEIDYSLVPKLIQKFGDSPNFELINKDILEVDPAETLDIQNGYKITGSLPYNISKQIIAKFITAEYAPEKMVFIVQDEVAKAYAANPPKATFLSNWLELFATVKKRESIPASQFFPKPKVDGGILEITTHQDLSSEQIRRAERLLKIGFSSPRKTLMNNLNSGLDLSKDELTRIFEKEHIKLTARPAELTQEEWQKLCSGIT